MFAAAGGSFVVLAVSGVMLARQYEAGAWAVYPGRSSIQTVHQGAATVFVIGALVLAGMAMLRRRPHQAGIAVAAVAVAVVGFVTGPMIAWDLVGVRSVQVGSSWRGVLKPAFDEEVRFVLIDGSEISQGTYRFWVLVHLVALPIALVVAAAVRSRLGDGADLSVVAVEGIDDGPRPRR